MIISRKRAGIIFHILFTVLLVNSFQGVRAEVGTACTENANCTLGEDCVNMKCSCVAGYTQNGNVCKADVGKACDVTNGCSNPYANCTGGTGSSTCQCNSGYNASGTQCKADVGKACDVTNGCSNPFASCTGGTGSSTCQCNSGYIASGTQCKADVGKACDVTNGCSNPYASCTAGTGSSTCQCNSGYTASGTQCKADIGLPCSLNDGCSNLLAVCNSTCQCGTGYYNPSGNTCETASALAVQNLHISSATENLLVVQWENPRKYIDVNKYTVSWKRLNQVGSPVSWHTEVNRTANSANISTNLISGAAYNIMVSSYQNSLLYISVPANYSTKPYKPGPLNENATNLDLDINGLTLAWYYNGTLSGVNVIFKIELIDNNNPAIVVLSASVSTKSFSESSAGLKNGYRYIVRITALSEEYGSGLRVTSESYTTLVKTIAKAPDPPGRLTCITINDKSIQLTWEAPSKPNGDIIQYLVETYNYSNQTLIKSENSSSNGTNFIVGGLNPGSPYRFKVYTQNEQFREATGSLLELCSTNSKMSNPPAILETSGITSRNFKLTWTTPLEVFGELVGYSLRITRTDNNSCVVEELTKCQSGCTYLFPEKVSVNCSNGLSNVKNASKSDISAAQFFNGAINTDTFNPDTTYTVSLAAINQGGKGYDNVISVTTKEEAPQKPFNLDVRNVTSKEATVAWSISGPRPGKTNYTIRLVADSPAPQKSFTVVGFSNTSFQLNGLEEYWHYSYTVEASTSNGSSISDTATLNTTAGPAGQVSQFSLTDGSGDDKYVTARVSWSLPEILQRNGPISSFYVQQEAIVNGTFTQISNSYIPKDNDVNHTYMTDFQALREKLYRFTVFAINGYNGTPTSMNYSASALPAPGSTVGALAGGIAGGAAALILIVVVFVLWRRKSTKLKKARRLSNDATESNMENLTKIKKQRPINLATFAEYVADYHKDSNLKFSEEYEDLKTLSPQHAHEAADMEENRLKNRFVNILPFDHSRVRLIQMDDVPGSDYINANYLPGFSKTREYIACQGPIPATIDDHWRLIWEQNVRVVVMLTQYKEENRVKCEPYMPLELKDPKQYGDIVVECLTYSSMNSFEYRTLKIRLGEKERTVKHFHFLSWRDYSANVQFDTMIDFIKKVRSFIQPPDVEGPMIVHCSAGVGRTGTYITIDHMIQHIDKNGPDSTIDIFNFVLRMRENRTTMVQTEQQYIFIHDCIKDYLDRFKTYENQGFIHNEDENLYQNTEALELYQNVNFNSTQKTEL